MSVLPLLPHWWIHAGEVNRCEAGNNPLGYYCTTQYNENKGNSTRYSFSSADVDGRKMEIIVSA